MPDTFGKYYTLTDWGDTHAPFIEGVVEGCPAGVTVPQDFVADEMARRAPSRHALSTCRCEEEAVEFLTGFDASFMTTGEPIRFRIANRDVQPNEANRYVVRPSHSSYTYFRKYGYADNEQCGRASARQTACRVVAGAIAKCYLRTQGVSFSSEVVLVATPCREGDTVGALVRGRITGLPAGLGQPLYDKFSARLAYAMLSINAAKGFEIGEGFRSARMAGSQYNDLLDPGFHFRSNHDGGVQAGITNGQEVVFSVAFKPVPSVRFDQPSVDFDGRAAVCRGSDRNDLCVAPRVLPVVEAMAAMVVMDYFLSNSL